MIRKLTTTLLAAICALAIAGGALAGSPAVTSLSEAVNYTPMPCFGLPDAFSATIRTTTTVTSASGRVQRDGTVLATIKAGILLTVQPNDPEAVSYIGGAAIEQSAVVPTDTQMAEIPVAIPVVGSDGSLSAAATVEMVFSTAVSGKKVQVAAMTGDVVCGDATPAPGIAVAPETQAAFKELIVAAGGPAAAQYLSGAIAKIGPWAIAGIDLDRLAKGLGQPALAKPLRSAAKMFTLANEKAQKDS